MVRQTNKNPERVLRAAAALFAQQGYHATTVDDVAAAVSLNKGTLYYYFSGKADLLFQICDTVVSEFTEAATQLPEDGSARDGLVAILRSQLELIAKRQNEVDVFLQELRWLRDWLSPDQYRIIGDKRDAFGTAVIELIEAGVHSGEFSDVDPGVASHHIMGIVAWASRWYRPRGGPPIDHVIDETIRLVFGGLSAPALSTSG